MLLERVGEPFFRRHPRSQRVLFSGSDHAADNH